MTFLEELLLMCYEIGLVDELGLLWSQCEHGIITPEAFASAQCRYDPEAYYAPEFYCDIVSLYPTIEPEFYCDIVSLYLC